MVSLYYVHHFCPEAYFFSSINAVLMQRMHGSTPDISPLLYFRFWEEVYYRHEDSDFPSDTREGHGYFVGIAENVDHEKTFKILTSDTNKVIYRFSVRSAEKGDRKIRAEMGRGSYSVSNPDSNIFAPDSEHGEDWEMGSSKIDRPHNFEKNCSSSGPPKIVQSRHDNADENSHPTPMPIFNPRDLVGRTFLLD